LFSHVSIGCKDPQEAAKFYSPVLATLGVQALFETPDAVAYGDMTGAKTFLLRPFDGEAPSPGNGWMAAYLAKTRDQVDAFHAKALELGGKCEGPPGLRAHYHANYYAAYVRDCEGNKLQAVCHSKQG